MFRFVAILIAFGALLLVQTESSRAQSLPTTTFKVKKIVTNSAGGAIGGYTYPISISCTGPTTTSANPSLAANGQHTMGGVMYTSVCTVSENVANFQVPAQYDCPSGNVPTWQAPVYSPGPSLTIGPVYMQTSNTIGDQSVEMRKGCPENRFAVDQKVHRQPLPCQSEWHIVWDGSQVRRHDLPNFHALDYQSPKYAHRNSCWRQLQGHGAHPEPAGAGRKLRKTEKTRVAPAGLHSCDRNHCQRQHGQPFGGQQAGLPASECRWP